MDRGHSKCSTIGTGLPAIPHDVQGAEEKKNTKKY